MSWFKDATPDNVAVLHSKEASASVEHLVNWIKARTGFDVRLLLKTVTITTILGWLAVSFPLLYSEIKEGSTDTGVPSNILMPQPASDESQPQLPATEYAPEPSAQPVKVNISDWVSRIIQQESGGNPNAASPKGARGLMQIMPATWDEWTKKLYGQALPFNQAYDPKINVQVGTAYLQWIQNTLREWTRQEPTIEQILAAYNGGIGRLRQYGFDSKKMGEGIPETGNYIEKIRGSETRR